MRTRERLPGWSPIAPSTTHLALEFSSDELPEKKMQLIGMSILIKPNKTWVGMSHDGNHLPWEVVASFPSKLGNSRLSPSRMATDFLGTRCCG
jgi:hypothetical protein